MSIILTEIGKTERTTKVYFGEEGDRGEALTFTYDPSKYTPLLEQRTQEAIDKVLVGTIYASMIDGVILSWDAEDIDPKDKAAVTAGTLAVEVARRVPFPPTSENIAKIPTAALIKIVRAIKEDQSESPEASGNSSGSFGGAEK